MTPASQAEDVVYPGYERNDYVIKLLSHALSYAPEKRYRAVPFGGDVPKHRAFEMMERGNGVDVVIGTGTKDRVDRHQAVHFPLLKGLNGLRIPLVAKNNVDLFAAVATKSQLKKLLGGQFHTWSDTRILVHNKLRVFASSNYEGLYSMLEKGRIDYFPRSVLEVQWNLDQHAENAITIDPHILIQYPSAFYYFVQKGNHKLAKDINDGLESALADGTFDKLFDAEYGSLIRDNRIRERRVIRLHNPLLSTETPVERAELWINHPKSKAPVDKNVAQGLAE